MGYLDNITSLIFGGFISRPFRGGQLYHLGAERLVLIHHYFRLGIHHYSEVQKVFKISRRLLSYYKENFNTHTRVLDFQGD